MVKDFFFFGEWVYFFWKKKADHVHFFGSGLLTL